MNNILRAPFSILYYFFRRSLIYGKGLLYKSHIKDAHEIPIIINNRNRFDCLLLLIRALEQRGYTNIIILDNDSTYPPLLDYYRTCRYRIIQLDYNGGYLSLQNSPIWEIIKKDYFVYTDPDVVPVEECPDDFMDYFWNVLKDNRLIQKVGFSLKIDDLPEHYEKKQAVIEWERQYYTNEIQPGLYAAPIDTTFALHRPFSPISTSGRYHHLRTASPYVARHVPWYADSEHPTEEDIYYKKTATIGGHWTNGIASNKKSR